MSEPIIKSFYRVRIYVEEPGKSIEVVQEAPGGKEATHVVDPEKETIAALLKRFKPVL